MSGRCDTEIMVVPESTNAAGSFGNWQRLFAAMLFVVIWTGCGPSNDEGRLPISGTVNFDGKPLANGHIMFRPDGKGLSSSSKIVDGRFELAAVDGIPVGQYKVVITSEQETGEKVERDPADWGNEGGGEMDPVTRQVIPARYNTATELKLVVDGPPAPLSYDLKNE